MLEAEPWERLARVRFEIATFSQSPQHLPAALTIFPVNLHYPALRPNRDQEIAGFRDVVQRVAVEPCVGFRSQKDRRASAATRTFLAGSLVERGAVQVQVIE